MGRFADALRAHEYYHDNALLVEGGAQGGVRLSFALSDWVELGQLYPPARKALDRRRAQAVTKGLGPPPDRQMFREALAIDEARGDHRASLELIDAFETAWPDRLAEFCDHHVRRVGLGEYRRCLNWLSDPAEVFNMAAGQFIFHGGYTGHGSDPKWARRYFAKDVAELLELLVGAGRTRQARRYVDLARRLYDHPSFEAAIDEARVVVRAKRQRQSSSSSAARR